MRNEQRIATTPLLFRILYTSSYTEKGFGRKTPTSLNANIFFCEYRNNIQ